MSKRLLACLGLMAACLAQEPLNFLKEYSLSQLLEEDFAPMRIAVLDDDQFVLLDQNSSELMILSEKGIIYRTGGFGQDDESFTEPVDLMVHNLQIWVCDRYENAVKRFDYKFNILGIDNVISNEYDPFYPDLITADPFGKAHILSRQYGQLLSMDNSIRALIDLNQYGIDGRCIVDIETDHAGNIALISCENEIILFNRFGRKSKTSLVKLIDPIHIFRWSDDWFVINSQGEIESFSGNVNILSLRKDETVLDADVYFQHLIILTDQRIMVLKK
ncbi:MAG: hypothetical protein QGF82_00505 [Candidatus Marinimicrobia bacterium]|nr:hypothetical protein [Candidatus Neomarinimicrobiota bacterium]